MKKIMMVLLVLVVAIFFILNAMADERKVFSTGEGPEFWSKTYGVPEEAIRDANPGVNFGNLIPGQTIKIPEKAVFQPQLIQNPAPVPAPIPKPQAPTPSQVQIELVPAKDILKKIEAIEKRLGEHIDVVNKNVDIFDRRFDRNEEKVETLTTKLEKKLAELEKAKASINPNLSALEKEQKRLRISINLLWTIFLIAILVIIFLMVFLFFAMRKGFTAVYDEMDKTPKPEEEFDPGPNPAEAEEELEEANPIPIPAKEDLKPFTLTFSVEGRKFEYDVPVRDGRYLSLYVMNHESPVSPEETDVYSSDGNDTQLTANCFMAVKEYFKIIEMNEEDKSTTDVVQENLINHLIGMGILREVTPLMAEEEKPPETII